MLYEILVRTTQLLAELEAAPVAGTYFKAAEDVPEMVQDFDAYIAFMTNPSHTQDNPAPKQFPNIVTFAGLLVGAQILTGLSFTNRINLMQYADLIGAKFNERRYLEYNSVRLANVEEAIFRGGRVFEGPYPQGQNQIIRRQYSFTLEVKYWRFRVQSH